MLFWVSFLLVLQTELHPHELSHLDTLKLYTKAHGAKVGGTCIVVFGYVIP